MPIVNAPTWALTANQEMLLKEEMMHQLTYERLGGVNIRGNHDSRFILNGLQTDATTEARQDRPLRSLFRVSTTHRKFSLKLSACLGSSHGPNHVRSKALHHKESTAWKFPCVRPNKTASHASAKLRCQELKVKIV